MVTVSYTNVESVVITALRADAKLLAIVAHDKTNNPGIYEGWHPPEALKVHTPYLTFRVNWYPRNPAPFVQGVLMIDIWDIQVGNNADTVNKISGFLLNLLGSNELVGNGTVVHSRLTGDEWIEDAVPGVVHRLVTFSLRSVGIIV